MHSDVTLVVIFYGAHTIGPVTRCVVLNNQEPKKILEDPQQFNENTLLPTFEKSQSLCQMVRQGRIDYYLTLFLCIRSSRIQS